MTWHLHPILAQVAHVTSGTSPLGRTVPFDVLDWALQDQVLVRVLFLVVLALGSFALWALRSRDQSVAEHHAERIQVEKERLLEADERRGEALGMLREQVAQARDLAVSNERLKVVLERVEKILRDLRGASYESEDDHAGHP